MVTRQNPYASPAAEMPIVAELVHDEQGLTIEYENKLADAIAFSVFHHTYSRYGKRQILIARIVILVGMLLVGGILTMDSVPFWQQPPLLAVFAATGLIAWIFYPALLRYRLQRALTLMYADGKNRSLDGPRRLTLSPEFLIYATPLSQTVIRWAAVERVVPSEAYLFIYVSSVSAVTVPREAFESPEVFRVFAERARELTQQAAAGMV